MPSFKPLWPLVTIPLLLTAACGTAVSDSCPALVQYDRPFMAAAADELAALPPGSKLKIMIQDYGTARAQIRACRGVK
ncbi:hypothetical protein [Nitrospirillum amazonense]|uniref:hypothetical protein n=1 Tax=Nitrospirillum amazonense TaxID=28077 RepID=UPI0024124183|nr:hypothetical protein [Nitrospirillum amazonense]MDG3442457.1 hypothetical protein [Nitrospirillum amazonense]